MRPYRGLTKEGRWMKGWYVYDRLQDKHYIFDDEVKDDWKFEVIPETVGQFTGLCDKNDKELDWWEGDIFNHRSGTYLIIYEEGGLYMQGPGGKCTVSEAAHWKESPVKIGNIHENPELWEQDNGDTRNNQIPS